MSWRRLQARMPAIFDTIATIILVSSMLVGFGYPAFVLILSAVVSKTNVAGNEVLEPVFWSVLDSSIVACIATVLATILTALNRSLPRSLSRIFDVIILIPATFSPFVIGAAVWRGVGRGGILDPGFFPPFFGRLAVIFTFTLALSPYAYALLRLSTLKVPLALIDICRVNGAGEWKIFRHTVWPRMRRGLPLAWLVVFILSVSDPVVPSLLSYPHPNASRAVWTLTTALGDTGGAARISLVLLMTTLGLGAIAFRALESRDLLGAFRGFEPDSNRTSFSQPVGLALWPRVATVSALAIVTTAPVIFMVARAGTNQTSSSPMVITTALVISLFTVVGSIVIAGSGLWLKARRPGRHVVDMLFGLALMVPGATTGSALGLAYGPSSHLAVNLSSTAQPVMASLLTVAAYLTLSAPLTYVSVRAYGSVLPRQDFETALMLGASVVRATQVSAQTWLRQSVAMSVTIVLAVSAVSVAPIMWVTSPSTPLLVPYLYRLIDHAEFGPAAILALAISAIILLLLPITSLLLRIRTSRQGGRS